MAGDTKKADVQPANPYEVQLGIGTGIDAANMPFIMRLDQAVKLWKKLAHAVQKSTAPVGFVLRVRGPGGVLRLSVLPSGERDAALSDLDRHAIQAIESEYPDAVAHWWRRRIAAGDAASSIELDLVDVFAGRKGHAPDAEGDVPPALASPQNSARLKKIVRLFADYAGWEATIQPPLAVEQESQP